MQQVSLAARYLRCSNDWSPMDGHKFSNFATLRSSAESAVQTIQLIRDLKAIPRIASAALSCDKSDKSVACEFAILTVSFKP